MERPAPPAPRPQAPLVLPWEASEHREKLSQHGVTIVVPVYNEENGVEGVMDRLSKLDIGVPIFVIAVNDGSKDRTAEVLARCAARIPNLRVVTHRKNQGYGAALKTGFTHAHTEVVVITDADGTYPEDKIRDLLDQIDDGAEMAVGSRTGADVNIPLVRKPAKWFLKQLASFLAATDIPDLNSGLRAFRRELVALRQLQDPPDPRHARLHRADHPHGALFQPAEGLLSRRLRAVPLPVRLPLLRRLHRAEPRRQDRLHLRRLPAGPHRRPARRPDREEVAAVKGRVGEQIRARSSAFE
ncbi:MAG: glycosyltransferase family 2 protein [Planctomycetota bacterium]|nr:glycosyltransferase family 2 protein [Planctomycetota bacterium]